MIRTKVFTNRCNCEESKPMKHDFLNIGMDWIKYMNNNDEFEPAKYFNDKSEKLVGF